jgi:hypothetical protein
LEQTRQEIQDHRRRVKELERAGQDTTGPTGDQVVDERDAEFRQSVKERHVKWQRERPAQAAATPRAARVKPAAPATQQPTDSAGWLAHAQEAVHEATTPAQLQAKVDSLARTAWKKKYPNVSPKNNAAYGRFVAQARQQADEQLQGEATGRLDAAEAWHREQGQEPPPALGALRDRLAGRTKPKGPTGFEDAVPMVTSATGEQRPVDVASLDRQEAQAKKQEAATPLPRIKRENTRLQLAKEQNEANAKAFGMTPEEYDRQASAFWSDRVDRAKSLRTLQKELRPGVAAMQGVARGDDEDKMKNLDTATDVAGGNALEDMSEAQLHALATGPEIKIPGPHDPKWHEEFVNSLRHQGILPLSERQQATAEPQPAEPEQEAQNADEFLGQGDAEVLSQQPTVQRREPPKVAGTQEEIIKKVEAAKRIKKAEEARRTREAAGKADLEAAPFTARRHPGTFADLYSALFWATVERSSGLSV